MPGPVLLEKRMTKGFCEDICKIIHRWNALENQILCLDLLPNEVIPDVNMFDPRVESLVEGQSNGTVVITEEGRCAIFKLAGGVNGSRP
jgi:hypothetical protein